MKKTLVVLALCAVAVPALAQTYGVPSYPPQPTSYCPQLSYNLYIGLSDYYTQGQVTQLQKFLSAQGYYQPITGYFGLLTRANVAGLQQRYAVYPVTGGVGPLTRAAIARSCGGDYTASYIVISPNLGYRPLQATLSVTAEAGPYMLSFGDGTTQELNIPAIMCFAAPCITPPQKVSHTYTYPGTYTASLTQGGRWYASATVTVY